MSKFKLYGEFEKVEEQEDGTLKVSGIASSEAVDSDGETITAEAMKAAIPDYMAFGALREMHTAWAAGTAIKCEVGADNRTYFEALVVDAEACKKVQTGTYKGFSIGGRVTKRDPLKKSTITGIKLVEVSLVDRPANPEAVFSMGKVEIDDAQTLGALRKGLYTVSDFAQILQTLAWMAQGTEDEAEYEGDASPIPAAFGQWVADGLALLQAMTAEEIAELIATLPTPEPQAALAMAAKAAGVDLAKGLSGAKKAAMQDHHDQLTALHKAMGDCMGKMAATWQDAPAEDGGEAGKAEGAKGLTVKVNVVGLPEVQAEVAKTISINETLAKAADTITKLTAENDTLAKRVSELESLPYTAKGVAVVFDADKQAEMFHKQAQDAESEDLKKYQEETDERAKYLLGLKFTHRWGTKPS